MPNISLLGQKLRPSGQKQKSQKVKKTDQFLWKFQSLVKLRSDRFIVHGLLPGPKTLFLDRYYFHSRVCVCPCVCVCDWVFISINSKSSWPILMKLSRMIDNDKRQVPLEDEPNRVIRTEVTENPYLYFFLIRPFDILFLRLLPLFYHWRGKMQ